LTKLEKEDMKEIIQTLVKIMKGIEIKTIEVRRGYTKSPRRRRTITVENARYTTISSSNFIDGIIVNTKEGEVFYIPFGHPLNSNSALSCVDIIQTIEFFTEILTKMKEREKELSEIRELLLLK